MRLPAAPAARGIAAAVGLCLAAGLLGACASHRPRREPAVATPPAGEAEARIQTAPAHPVRSAPPAPAILPAHPPAPPPSARPESPPPPEKPVQRASIPAALARLSAVQKSPFLTRAQLAELLAALPGLPLERVGETAIMTDILEHPAREIILAVVGGGYLEAFPNHQFKPEAFLTRTELAESLARVAARMALPAGAPSPEEPLPDLPRGNPFYPSVRRAVSLGLMPLGPDGSFGPTAPVSGAEGWESLIRLHALLAARRG